MLSQVSLTMINEILLDDFSVDPYTPPMLNDVVTRLDTWESQAQLLHIGPGLLHLGLVRIEPRKHSNGQRL